MCFKRIKLTMVLVALMLVLAPRYASAEILWHWQSPFDSAEQRKLKSWITTTVAAVESTVAPYPFDVHIYFHRLAGKGEPIPWANTNRNDQQAIHFHVDTSYSEGEFLQDWTAPHELSHLLIPYVGRSYSWFSEGFASFMQYQIMAAMGVMKKPRVQKAYQSKVEQAQRKYFYHELPFHSAA